MARRCGVCLRPPREGEEMFAIRITEQDLQELHSLAKEVPCTEVGLYQSCLDCVEEHRVRVAERMKLDINQVTNRMLA
jgi:hypothetical protein